MMKINNFTVIESEYGRFIVNRHCDFQADALIKTGRPHIQAELNNILTLVGVLPDKCFIVDAGANIGLVAIPIAQAVAARGGVVYAFEVQRMFFYALCGSVALNDLENLIVRNEGLSSSHSVIGADKLDYGKPQDFGLFSLVNHTDAGPEKIVITTVDSLGLPQLDFFKIDVEGMEIDVLRGARATIEKHLPWCWIEYWKVDIDDIKKQFGGLRYKFYLIDKLNMLCAPEEKLTESRLNINAPEV